jgi:hypothetical protein
VGATKGSSRRIRFGALAIALALVGGLVGPSAAFATKTVGISSPSFDFNMAQGQSGKGELYVINDGTEPIKVMVYTANQKTDAKGQVTYEIPRVGEAGNQGPAVWFRIQMPEDSKSFGNTPYVELTPKQRVLVKFSFEVPPGVPAGDHQVILFFEMFDFPAGGGMLSSVTGRIGSRIRVRVQGTLVEKMDVQPFSVRELVIGEMMPWDFVARNDGNVDKPTSAKLALLDSSEREVLASDVMTETVLFARSMIEKSGVLSLSGAGIGKYTARLTLTYPTEPDVNGEQVPVEVTKDRTVWVFPLWLVIGLVVVIGVLALWTTWRGAVRAAERRASRPPRTHRTKAKKDVEQSAHPNPDEYHDPDA